MRRIILRTLLFSDRRPLLFIALFLAAVFITMPLLTLIWVQFLEETAPLLFKALLIVLAVAGEVLILLAMRSWMAAFGVYISPFEWMFDKLVCIFKPRN